MGIEGRVVAEKRRAIGTDDVGGVAHIEIHMRVVERGQLALAHEFARPDLDDRDARRIVEMRNDPLGHVFVRIYPRGRRMPRRLRQLVALRGRGHHKHRQQSWPAKSV